MATGIVVDTLVPTYRYFVTDLLTNTLLAEVPFTGVSYERAIKGAGGFSGSIPMIDKTTHMDLYDSTMPGRTGLYVVRDGECVWGGIIWARSYNVKEKALGISASEFTSYFHHRNIWKTWTHDYGATVVVSGGVANVTLDGGYEFNFQAGSSVRADFYEVGNFQYNDYYTILASPAPTSDTFSFSAGSIPNGTYALTTITVRTDTYDYIRQLLDDILIDFAGVEFPNDEIEPAIAVGVTVSNKVLTNNVVTLTTTDAHNITSGQVVKVDNVGSPFDGNFLITSIPSDTTFQYEVTAANVASTAVANITKTVTTKKISTYVATLTTDSAHGFSVGQAVIVSGVDDPTSASYSFDGTQVITSVPTSTTFTYVSAGGDVEETSAPDDATAELNPVVIVSTYGPYSGNSDIGITYSTDEYSGKNVPNKIYRGFELRSAGEELDDYSDAIEGFEYRVDCYYDAETSSFGREFVLIPIDFPDPPAPGEVSPISRFGADQLVFEYPGNIVDVTIDESSDEAATRFWVVGKDPALGEDASEPYAAATAVELLLDGWPIIDQDESANDTIDEAELYAQAERYLAEHRPPIADIKVEVNGSLNPVVGTYAPGDWCSLIIDDEFVRMRLASDLEPRDTVIVRKIEKIKVSVPDNPAFPEKVSLDLIAEWLVDKRG
jgi:hypothetical protein